MQGFKDKIEARRRSESDFSKRQSVGGVNLTDNNLIPGQHDQQLNRFASEADGDNDQGELQDFSHDNDLYSNQDKNPSSSDQQFKSNSKIDPHGYGSRQNRAY